MVTINRLKDKVVFITGSTSGIGEFCAREFARNEAKVILTGRRKERLDSLKQELSKQYSSANVHAALMDVRSRSDINRVIAELPDGFKDIDILINNAGLVVGVDHVADISDERIDTIFDTNVKGLLYTTQAILPKMKERNEGHIINIGSIAGKEAYPGGGVYCASKHAVNALTRTLRMELIQTNIRVSEINPGMVETEFSLVRFSGDSSAAEKVYKGIEPLAGQDIAEIVSFVASRPPHVQIADIVVFPTNQASVLQVHRESQ